MDMSPLPTAANRNDPAEVRRLLAEKQFTQNDLDLALARAVLDFSQRRAIAELLIDAGADPNGQYGSNYGPIVLATAECVDPDGLQFLIDHGCDVAFAPIDSKYGMTSPMLSILSTYVRGRNAAKRRFIDILVKHGAFVPGDVTPEVLAVHRGDVAALAAAIDREPAVVRKRYPRIIGGNIELRGATLLHLAVDLGEIACVDLLMSRDADVNQPAEVIDGVGGQSAVFHAIATNMRQGLPVLQHLVFRYGGAIDPGIRATLRLSEGTLIGPVTPIGYAEQALRDDTPQWRRASAKELELLRSIAAS